MKTKKNEVKDGRIEIKVQATAKEVEEAMNFIDFQMAMQNGVPIHGLQDPASISAIVRERLGSAYYDSFIDFQTANFLAPFAITQEKLAIIGPPKVATTGIKVDRTKPLEFTVEAVLKPSFTIEDFSPVKIRLPKLSVSDEEVSNQMAMMADSRATYEKDEDRAVRDGDDLVFAIKTTDADGEEVKNLCADKRNYKLGANYLPKDFDDNIIGMQVGETKTFDVESPLFNKEYTTDPSVTATFTFTITILELQKKVIPAITDEWVAKNMHPLKTVPELREEVRKQGLVERAKELENIKNYQAASEFAKRFKAPIDDQYYELTRDDILHNMHQQLQAQGRNLQEFIEEQGGGEQQFSMQLMMQTREVLVQGFSLDALAKHLKLQVSDEDINEVFASMAPGQEYEIRMEFEMTGRMYLIQEAALRNKANKWLVENAEITELDDLPSK